MMNALINQRLSGERREAKPGGMQPPSQRISRRSRFRTPEVRLIATDPACFIFPEVEPRRQSAGTGGPMEVERKGVQNRRRINWKSSAKIGVQRSEIAKRAERRFSLSSLDPNQAFPGALWANSRQRQRLETGRARIGGLQNRLEGDLGAVDIGGLNPQLGPAERMSWAGFAPLQRVLIVAVSAAATAAAARSSEAEIGRLQRAVEARDHALDLIRKQMGDLWREGVAVSPPPRGGSAQQQQPSSPLAAPVVVQSPDVRGWKVWDVPGGALDPEAEPGGPSGAEQGLWSLTGSTEAFPFLPTATTSPRALPRTPFACDPERGSGNFDPSASGSHSPRTAVKQLTQALAREGSPSIISIPGSVAEATQWRRQSCPATLLHDVEAQLALSRARCAAAIGKAKDEAIAILNREAAAVLSALVVVVRKAKELEELERGSQDWSREGLGMTAVKQRDFMQMQAAVGAQLRSAVERASGQIMSLQAAVADTWHALGPAAMAALQVMPADLRGLTCGLSTSGLNWQVPCQESFDFSSSRESDCVRVSSQGFVSHDPYPTEALPLSISEDVRQSTSSRLRVEMEGEFEGGVEGVVHRAVGMLMQQEEEGLSGRRDSGGPDAAMEHLLCELENTAAKVADMEGQLQDLQASLRRNEAKRLKAAKALKDALDRDFTNQSKARVELEDLSKELELRDGAIAELQRSHRFVVAAKDREVEGLRAELKQREEAVTKLTRASEAARLASEARLRECREKDATISCKEAEINQLEKKIKEQDALLDQLQRASLKSPRPPRFTSGYSSPGKDSSQGGSAPTTPASTSSPSVPPTPRPSPSRALFQGKAKEQRTGGVPLEDVPATVTVRKSTGGGVFEGGDEGLRGLVPASEWEEGEDYLLSDQAVSDMMAATQYVPPPARVEQERGRAEGQAANSPGVLWSVQKQGRVVFREGNEGAHTPSRSRLGKRESGEAGENTPPGKASRTKAAAGQKRRWL